MHWKDVIAQVLEPKEKLASVIDTYIAIGEILEARKKVASKEYFSLEDFDKAMLNGMFTLGFFAFWQAHGHAIRPLFLQAIQSEKTTFIEDFFSEAIPCALTIAMPHRQLEYAEIRKVVQLKFRS
jgi:hypothetical protein